MKHVALALGAALGIAHIALAERRHRDRKHIAFVGLHAELSRDTAADPRFADLVNSSYFEDLDADGRARMITCNRWVNLWSAMLRHGYITKRGARNVAETFMQSETNRDYWVRASPYRRTDFRDRHDERFFGIMADAFDEVRLA
ncbi:DUF6082 family protein [Streptomyces sp. NPDC006134]|uniref:DUF6082 family protein n=1 Tax=Streptomyces sp. NPDC006134 TaxID=3154467 RepID=UPI0033D11F24